MRSAYRMALVVGLLLHHFGCIFACDDPRKNTGEEISISVDPRVELFSTIHRLAGTHQYDDNHLPGYIRDVEDHFGRFRDHRAVRLAVELRESHNLDGNSPMALAVYLTDPPGLEGRGPLLPPPERAGRLN